MRISAVITAAFGGFYLDTCWPQCASQVVWCQQVNVLLSITILRGFGAFSPIKQYILTKRSVRRRSSRTDDRSAATLIFQSQPTQRPGLTPPEAPETIQINEDGSDDGASIVPSMFVDKPSNEPLTQIALQPFDSLLEAHLYNYGIEANGDKSDDETDEDETILAQQWSEACQSERRSATAENNKTDTLTNVDNFGAERKRDHGVVKWWYLTKPHDIAVFSGYKEEPESAYGHVVTRSPLKSGYQSIQFSPKWVRCRLIREELRAQLREKIEAKFWSLTSSVDDVRWDGRKNQYQNFSTGSLVHLCGEKECERCWIVAQQHSMVVGAKEGREGTSTDICMRVTKVFTVESEIATILEQRVPQPWGKVEVGPTSL